MNMNKWLHPIDLFFLRNYEFNSKNDWWLSSSDEPVVKQE